MQYIATCATRILQSLQCVRAQYCNIYGLARERLPYIDHIRFPIPVLKHTSIPITQYKLSLERNFRGKIVDSTLKKKTNSLGFPVTSTSKREKKIATQDMMIRACALGFLPLNFSSNLGGKIILEWGNGGSLPAGVSRPPRRRCKKKKKASCK